MLSVANNSSLIFFLFFIFFQDNETFTDDGVWIEPFNLSKEREEGYFDASGNYVEYIKENQIKVSKYFLVISFLIRLGFILLK